ncbi:MAG: hypothetical protein M3033_03770 [Acidobacteriota bacterium]|nr:hypothetical protein [Acidobacteriota bacterium]
MKKLLTLSILAGSIALSAFSAEAKTTTANALAANKTAVQVLQIRRNGRIVRTQTQTRIVRVGRHAFRETYQTRYLPNGRVKTRLISRVQIR